MPNRCSGFHRNFILRSYFLYSVTVFTSQAQATVLSCLGVYSRFPADIPPFHFCPVWKVDGKKGPTSFLLPVFVYLAMGLGRSSLQKGSSVSLYLLSGFVTYFGQWNVAEARMWGPDVSRSFTYISALPLGATWSRENSTQPEPSEISQALSACELAADTWTSPGRISPGPLTPRPMKNEKSHVIPDKNNVVNH